MIRGYQRKNKSTQFFFSRRNKHLTFLSSKKQNVSKKKNQNVKVGKYFNYLLLDYKIFKMKRKKTKKRVTANLEQLRRRHSHR